MVSIVIVSHSEKLAQGIYELADQMCQGKTKIALAAGIDDMENPIGTDAVAVMSAVESVYDSSGVLIMVDMGSAILSAEMALDLCDPSYSENVRICSAPIVEGTISASVAASAGLDIDSVEKEAHRSLYSKYSALNQLDYLIVKQEREGQRQQEGEVTEFSCRIENEHGLHARPCAAIVNVFSKYDSSVDVICGEESANGKSLSGLSVLGVRKNDTILVRAIGPDSKTVIDEFSQLAKSGFGESVITKALPTKNAPTLYSSIHKDDDSIVGNPVFEGIACGKVRLFNQERPTFSQREYLGVTEEKRALASSIEKVISELTRLIKSPDSNSEQENIFEAHILMIIDEDFQASIKTNIEKGIIAEQSVFMTVSDLAREFKEANSDYMRAREADVWDIGRQIIDELCGKNIHDEFVFDEPIILVGNELSPSNTARIDSTTVSAICLHQGDISSHSAVIAKSKGIPTIFNLNGSIKSVEKGQRICVDAYEGRVWYNPDSEHYQNLSTHYNG